MGPELSNGPRGPFDTAPSSNASPVDRSILMFGWWKLPVVSVIYDSPYPCA